MLTLTALPNREDSVCTRCHEPTPAAWECGHCRARLCPDCDSYSYEHDHPRTGRVCVGGIRAAMLAEMSLQAAADAAE
jgi:hypothetical protein